MGAPLPPKGCEVVVLSIVGILSVSLLRGSCSRGLGGLFSCLVRVFLSFWAAVSAFLIHSASCSRSAFVRGIKAFAN